MCKVLNRKDGVPKGAVSIGRPSKFGNPFIIGVHGDRNEVCDKFDTYWEQHPELQQAAKEELKGKDLVCFCKPLRCHGDIIIKTANE